jgi:MFS family permease
VNRYPWICVALLWVVWLLNYLDREVVFAVFPLLQSELGLTAVQLGMVGAAFLWVYAAASPFAGYVADRFGHKWIIVASVLIWSVITWATGQAHTFRELIAARAVMGLSEACYLPAALALIAVWHKQSTRGKATGLHYSGGYLGVVLGGTIGGWLAARYGWRSPFTILGIFGVCYSLILGRWLKDRPQESKLGSPPVKSLVFALESVFRLPGYLPFFTVFAILSIANWLIYTWLPLYLYENFRMGLAAAGFTSTFYLQIGSAAGVLAGGWIADRWVGRTPRARVITQSVSLAIAAPFLILSGSTKSIVLVAIGMVVFGIGRGTFDANAMPALCQIAPPSLRATGFGILNFIGPLSGGVTSIAAGALKSFIGISGAIQISGLLLFASAFLLWRIYPKSETSEVLP